MAVIPREANGPVPPTVFTDKVILEIDGLAKTNGSTLLVVQPTGQDPVVMTVGVVAEMTDKDIVGDIAKELQLTVGSRDGLEARGEGLELETSSKNSPASPLDQGSRPVQSVGFRLVEDRTRVGDSRCRQRT